MKTLLFSFLILISFVCRSQNYFNGKMYIVIFDENMKVISENPFGRNVTLKYDEFFKTYSGYIPETENGGWSSFDLSFVQALKSGNFRYKEEKPKGTFYYTLINDLENGNLVWIDERIYTNDHGISLYSAFKITGLKLK